MKYYLIPIVAIFSNSLLYAGAETINRDGKVTFAYDEEQIKVDAFNAQSATATMTNQYTKPSAFEVMVATTMARPAFNKSSILEEIKKQKSELTLLESLKNDEGIDTSAEQAVVKRKLAGLKHAYNLAP